MLLRFLALIAAVLLSVAAEAKSVALVIGNNAYEEIPELMKAVGDADAMATKLEGLGFKVVKATDLNRAAMSRTMSRFEAAIAPGDTAFFFYSGHGFALDGENFLLPTDVPQPGPDDAELIRDASFPLSRIVDRIQRRGAGAAILVIDACRDNPFEEPGKRSLPGQRGLARMDAPHGVFVLYSAGVGQSALDRLSDDESVDNSVFTRVLLKTLDKPGLTLVRLAKETQLGVRSLALEVGHEQTPAYYDQIIGDIVLNPEPTPPPVAPPAQETTTPVAVTPAAPPAGSTEVALTLPPNLLGGSDRLNEARGFYENARKLEAKGDALGARRAYMALAEVDLDVVDPYLRLATLVRVQDGRAGAREVFAALQQHLHSPALQLVYGMQFEDRERANRLRAFLTDHPSYGPALYLAAQELGDDRLGRRSTLTEKRRQLAYLDKFLEAEAQGRLTSNFLDQSLLGEWTDDARTRQKAINGTLEAAAKGPTASFMRSNAGWTVTITPPEPAMAILWREAGGEGEMTDLGVGEGIDPLTGKPVANSMIELPSDYEEGALEITYRDSVGERVGPFTIEFNPDDKLQAQAKDTLWKLHNSWIETRRYNGKLLLYSTTLVTYNCGIKNVYYGVDGAEPDEAIPLPDCNTDDPYAIPEDFTPYLELTGKPKRVSIQIEWYDGEWSDVLTYKVKG